MYRFDTLTARKNITLECPDDMQQVLLLIFRESSYWSGTLIGISFPTLNKKLNLCFTVPKEATPVN